MPCNLFAQKPLFSFAPYSGLLHTEEWLFGKKDKLAHSSVYLYFVCWFFFVCLVVLSFSFSIFVNGSTMTIYPMLCWWILFIYISSLYFIKRIYLEKKNTRIVRTLPRLPPILLAIVSDIRICCYFPVCLLGHLFLFYRRKLKIIQKLCGHIFHLYGWLFFVFNLNSDLLLRSNLFGIFSTVMVWRFLLLLW